MSLEGYKGEDGTCPTCRYNGRWGWYMTNPPKCPACYHFNLKYGGLPEIPDERSAIVKWLRSADIGGAEYLCAGLSDVAATAVADAIDAGKHLK